MLDNNFLSYDLTKTWQISQPAIKGYPEPPGPPVSNGYLWASYDSLYLYGGEFSYQPPVSPAPVAMWEYDIKADEWIEHSDPETSSGTNSPSDQEPVHRVAEGAGFSMASLGRGWYFGGHEDGYTTPGWSAYSTPRLYLTSLLEFTFPGRANDGIQSLSGGQVAGPDGAWRNVTQGALATPVGAGFPERADGVLVYIPGFGDDGVLLGLFGGDTKSFTQTNIIDVYDVKTSTWYKQATTGGPPKPRVNPCAVVAAAADGSSYQVYVFAGQNLQPAGQQIQYNDMWVLTVPSFEWMQVEYTPDQSVPPGRSGHTCNIWNSQMVVVGGYVGDIGCDYPGVYVFNTSSLSWQTQYTAIGSPEDNPQNQQTSQQGDSTGLQGSFGYQVPAPIQSVLGGGPSGGATQTTPVATATDGPIATGTPVTYPVNGGTNPTTGGSGDGGDGGSSSGSSGSDHVGAIVAGVVAGVAGIVAIYLAFVTWIYRKRMRDYKANVDRFGWQPSSREESKEDSRGRDPNGYTPVSARQHRRTSSTDLLGGSEPTFVGIMLHPRRSLRVTNPD